jgi:hypothetical protein
MRHLLSFFVAFCLIFTQTAQAYYEESDETISFDEAMGACQSRVLSKSKFREAWGQIPS